MPGAAATTTTRLPAYLSGDGDEWIPDTAAAPIDGLIPLVYRQSQPAYVSTSTTVTVSYERAGPRECASAVVAAPAVARHHTERAAAAAGYAGVGTVSPASFIRKPEGAANVKEGLLEMLLVQGGGGEAGEAAAAAQAASQHEEVYTRLHGERCDATYVTGLPLLARLVSLVLASRADPARAAVGCVTALNISHTCLGPVGARGPPAVSDSSDKPYAALRVPRFFPDEAQPRERSSQRVKARVARRSLALCVVAPLLWVPDTLHYRVTALVCTHCALTDDDAAALALILRARHSKSHSCALETVDAAFNDITDAGAERLLGALKANRRVTSLVLHGNRQIRNRGRVLERIDARLQRNRELKLGAAGVVKRRLGLFRKK